MPTPSLSVGVESRALSPAPNGVFDRSLSNRFRAGDTDALREVIQTYYARLHRVAVHVVRDMNVADRVAAEAFIQAFDARDLLDPAGDAWSWVARVGIHLMLAAPRPRGGVPVGEDPRLSGLVALAAARETSFDTAFYCALADAVDSLSDSLRVICILATIDRSPVAEIAAIVGASEATIGLRLHEARRTIRDRLGALGALPQEEIS